MSMRGISLDKLSEFASVRTNGINFSHHQWVVLSSFEDVTLVGVILSASSSWATWLWKATSKQHYRGKKRPLWWRLLIGARFQTNFSSLSTRISFSLLPPNWTVPLPESRANGASELVVEWPNSIRAREEASQTNLTLPHPSWSTPFSVDQPRPWPLWLTHKLPSLDYWTGRATPS